MVEFFCVIMTRFGQDFSPSKARSRRESALAETRTCANIEPTRVSYKNDLKSRLALI